MKKRSICLGLMVLVLTILGTTLSVSSQSPTCPQGQPVCHTITPMGGHSTAASLPASFNCNCPGDGRRVINLLIDPSWGATTNPRIWNAVQCAVSRWNNATDGANPPNKTGYYLQVDQAKQIANPPDITIKNQTPVGSPFASTGLTPSGWEMRLAPINATLSAGPHPDEDLCGRVAHELGHVLGLNGISVDCFSIMHSSNTDGTRSWNTVTANDVFQVNRNLDNTTRTNGYCKPPQNLSDTPGGEASPTPTPEPDPCASQIDGSGLVIANALCTGDGGDLEESGMGECNDGIDNDQDGLIDCDEGSCGHYCISGCSNFQQELCVALGAMGCWQGQCYTPILIDVNGDGYKMTNVDNGVNFKVLSNFPLTKVSWTAEGSDDAWLVLDRNGNGTIDSGEEQFGNATLQPWSMEKNGFKALTQYDHVFNGGQEDGVIDGRDAVFAQLRLWCDRNHNGISEPDELSDLRSAGVFGIDLNYKDWKRVDEFGNAFRYRAKVLDGSGHSLGKWAFDVFLRTH